MICGEGFPNFYAHQIVDAGTYCVGEYADIIMGPILRLFGACKSVADYNYDTDSDGNPLIKEC